MRIGEFLRNAWRPHRDSNPGFSLERACSTWNKAPNWPTCIDSGIASRLSGRIFAAVSLLTPRETRSQARTLSRLLRSKAGQGNPFALPGVMRYPPMTVASNGQRVTMPVSDELQAAACVKAFRKVALAVALILLASSSHALPLMQGSLSLSGISVSQNGANLAVSTLVTAGDTIVTGPGLGDYAPVALFSSFGPHVLDLSSMAALASSFSLSNAIYGSYTATSAVIIQRTPAFLDLFLTGWFSPVGLLAGFDPTPTGLRVSVNQSGRSDATALTLNSVPEPMALALFGIGLTGVVMVRRRQSA